MYCTNCKGGLVNADSSNDMSNFRHHTESYSARSSIDMGQTMMAKDEKLARKFNQSEHKEFVASTIIRHGYTHEGNRTIYVYLNEYCVLISRNKAKSHYLKIHKCEKWRLMASLMNLYFDLILSLI